MNICFDNIRIVSPLQSIDIRGYLWIEDGIIRHAGAEAPETTRATTHIQADDLTAAPGFFDMHVHLREPGQSYKETIESGTAAAANGGFTGVVCMPNTEPAVDSIQVVEFIHKRAAGLLTDVHVCATITKGRRGSDLAAIETLLNAGAVMFSDDGGCVESAEMMRRAFDYVSTFDALLTQHCEEHSMTKNFAMHEGTVSAELGLKGYPSVAEDIIVARDILLAEYCGNRRYHAAHLSSAGTIRLLRDAKVRGQRVTGEVAPHHFVLTHDAVRGYNTNAKMNPPLRTQADVDAMIQALADNVIDVIATDHAPHALHEKNVEFDAAPNGIVGLETAVGLTLTHLYHTKVLSIQSLVEKMSVNPRHILGLPQPMIENGSSANITILNLDKEWTVNTDRFLTKSKNSPFGATELKGVPVYAINNGKMIACTL
ncbi:MAG: dihydroorotase [Candidatus Kapabacteria bacterium]|nr:dihydroorotase [Candidatus Kapabacteria bacterium]